jgi:hypothetical protein
MASFGLSATIYLYLGGGIEHVVTYYGWARYVIRSLASNSDMGGVSVTISRADGNALEFGLRARRILRLDNKNRITTS